MNDVHSHAESQALAQILESDQHHHHPYHPDFSHHSHPHKSEVIEGHHVHGLDIPTGEDDTAGEEELELALGDMGTPDMDPGARTNSFGRPPSIRKGE